MLSTKPIGESQSIIDRLICGKVLPTAGRDNRKALDVLRNLWRQTVSSYSPFYFLFKFLKKEKLRPFILVNKNKNKNYFAAGRLTKTFV